MQAIAYETPKTFIPEVLHVDILQAVSRDHSCPPRRVVERLLPSYTERVIRSGIRNLLVQGYLAEDTPGGGIVLRLTSKGRILLQKEGAA